MDSGDAMVMDSSDATVMDCGDATGATSMNSGHAITVTNVCAPPSSNLFFSTKSLLLFVLCLQMSSSICVEFGTPLEHRRH
jgi:hypothetical protein